MRSRMLAVVGMTPGVSAVVAIALAMIALNRSYSRTVWSPLARAGSRTEGTSGTAGATRPDALISAIAALAAIGIVMLWLRSRR